MPWYAWVLVAVFAINSLVVIAKIGKPRERLTSTDAIVILVCNGLMTWAVVALAMK